MKDQNTQKPDYLVYSNENITQIVTMLGQLDIKGIPNIKNVYKILSLLENPYCLLPMEAFKQDDRQIVNDPNNKEK
jgi:hypothetical protein